MNISDRLTGIPTYGRTYTLKDVNRNGVDAPVDGLGEPGPYTLSEGSLGFNEVEYLANNFAIPIFHIKIFFVFAFRFVLF